MRAVLQPHSRQAGRIWFGGSLTAVGWRRSPRDFCAPYSTDERARQILLVAPAQKSSDQAAWYASTKVLVATAIGAAGISMSSQNSSIACESAQVSTESEALQRPEVVESLPPSLHIKDCHVRLYQFESCPFCRKVRSCLDYHRIAYELVEVEPLTKAETKQIAPDYKKVPILHVETPEGLHFQMRDSKTIVRALLGTSNPGVDAKVPLPCATPATGNMWSASPGASVEEEWVRWTDKVLVQCIVLNVYRTMKESAETFQYLLTHSAFPWYVQRAGALSGTVVMWGVAKSRKRKYEVTDERAALFEALDAFALAVNAGGGPFMGGERPGAVDFNVFGILRSAESCQTERDMLEQCTTILPWYASMQQLVGSSCARNADKVKRGS